MIVRILIGTFGRNLRDWAFPRYRPEKHYMRGPGPACAARGRGIGQV